MTTVHHITSLDQLAGLTSDQTIVMPLRLLTEPRPFVSMSIIRARRAAERYLSTSGPLLATQAPAQP